MEQTCTRRIQFCAGHRVLGHEGKCANLHGHNYVALFTAMGHLDSVGRVIDFSVLKEKIGGWIDLNWDHGFLFSYKDTVVHSMFLSEAMIQMKSSRCSFNPTAEEMARYLLEHVCVVALQNTGVRVVKVQLWETENCFATAEL